LAVSYFAEGKEDKVLEEYKALADIFENDRRLNIRETELMFDTKGEPLGQVTGPLVGYRPISVAAETSLSGSSTVRYMMGELYEKKSDYSGAIREYNAAVLFDPKNIYAYEKLGKMYMKMGEVEAAVLAWQRGLAINSNFLLFREDLGGAYEVMGEKEKAIEEYKIITKSVSNYANAYLRLAVIYAKDVSEKETARGYWNVYKKLAGSVGRQLNAEMEAMLE